MISVVIPLYNEEDSVTPLLHRLTASARQWKSSYEILFIDDGSTDHSLAKLQALSKKDSHLRIYSFRKNRGKSEALTFGFQKALGEIIVTLDADLQDKPEEITKLIKKLKEGYGVVCGWRKVRSDATKMKVISKIFNKLMQMMWGLSIHDYNCGLKAYQNNAAKGLRLYGGMHRFIPILIYQQGYTVTEVAVEHDKRQYGMSKFGFKKIFTDLPDMFTIFFLLKYGKKPLHFFGFIGILFLISGCIILLYLSFLKLYGIGIGDRPLFFLGMLLIISGFQTFFTGFLADLIINIQSRTIEDGDISGNNLKYSKDP